VLVAALLSGCASATVERRDTEARVQKVPGEGSYTWAADVGWVQPRYGGWGSKDAVRADSLRAFQEEAYADALAGFLHVEKLQGAEDEGAAELFFHIAECYYHLGAYDTAVEYYTKAYRNPKSTPERTQQAHRRVYDIAMDFLHGRAACSFVGFNYGCPGHGIDLLIGDHGLITEYRYLEFADDALMEIADHYYRQKQYPEAVPLYERVVREYCPGQSEWCERASYQVALSTFKQVRGVDYDQGVLLDAKQKLQSYLLSYPRGPNATTVRDVHIRDINEMIAERYVRVAKFYLRDSQPRAARIYLRLVLEKHTNTEAAREAREIQRRLDDASAVN
jgi:outer membrane protein assembly factor BamD (BamD/ComL family)